MEKKRFIFKEDFLLEKEGVCKEQNLLLPYRLVNRGFSANALDSSDLAMLVKKLNFFDNFGNTRVIRKKETKEKTVSLRKEDVVIIDCRFDYEFKGGSIKESINISDPRVIEHIFIKNKRFFQLKDFRLFFTKIKGKSVTIETFEILKREFVGCSKFGFDFSFRLKQKVDFKHLSKFLKAKKTHNKKQKKGFSDPYIYITEAKKKAIRKRLKSFLSSDKGLLEKKENYRENFLKKKLKKSLQELVIIFYCEFSSKRAPSLYGHLRNLDRLANMKSYPSLFYPNIYLLDGGYSKFVKNNDKFCVGKKNKYRRMLDKRDRGTFFKRNEELREIWAGISNNRKTKKGIFS